MNTLPTGKEILVDKTKVLLTRTDKAGIIEYANHDFLEVAGYSLGELVHQPHNIIRHPDMPAVIFKLMWSRIKSGADIFAVVKNLAKNGDHYWVTTKFEIRKHAFDNSVVGYAAFRRAADRKLVDIIAPLYGELLEIEKYHGIDASEKYLLSFLESKRMTYDQYMDSLVDKKGFLGSFLKGLFG